MKSTENICSMKRNGRGTEGGGGLGGAGGRGTKWPWSWEEVATGKWEGSRLGFFLFLDAPSEWSGLGGVSDMTRKKKLSWGINGRLTKVYLFWINSNLESMTFRPGRA